MPSGDRTGPLGDGSMTGRGLGYCTGARGVGQASKADIQPDPGKGFGGWGLLVPFGQAAKMDPETEKRFLRGRIHVLQSEIDWIKNRIDEIE